MLNTAVTAADVVRNSAGFDPWGATDVGAGPVIADLKSCRGKVMSQRKAVKDTRERWFSAETVASSAVGVRISDFVELGTCSMWQSIRNLVSLAVVGLNIVPGRVRRGERQ